MTRQRLVDSPLAVWGGVALILYAATEFTARTEESLRELPVIVTKKLVANAPAPTAAKSQTRIGGLYPVFVMSAQVADSSETVRTPIPDAQLDRLFALDLAKARAQANKPDSDPGKIGLPVPGAPASAGRRPGGVPNGAMGATPEAPSPNMFRVDGITDGGAFITGRYFKVGDELEGIDFPVPLAPGEKAMLSGVSFQTITLMLGSRKVELSRAAQ